MAKIVVFDSGLGSLSIIKPIQKKIQADIIYFADQKNFPYGTKSINSIRKIINSTIIMLEKKFEPDLIVVGSNTPSLLLKNIIKKSNIIGVFPPLKEAVEKTKTKTIAILATRSVVKSITLKKYVEKNVPKKIKTIKINASPLIELVESSKFIYNKTFCLTKIRQILAPLLTNNADVATLSSTHLPFLLPLLKQAFPRIIFIDSGNFVAEKIAKELKNKSGRGSLQIFASGNTQTFQKKLFAIGMKHKVLNL
jgi:glutamate racemase